MRPFRTAALQYCFAPRTVLPPALADTVKVTFLLTNDIYKVDNTSLAAASPGSTPW